MVPYILSKLSQDILFSSQNTPHVVNKGGVSTLEGSLKEKTH